MTDKKTSPAGVSWEDVKKELYSPEVRARLDKEVDKISEQINKSNH
jgi:rubredoxin